MNSLWPVVALGEVAKLFRRSEEVLPSKTYRQIGVKWWGKGIYERDPIDGFETRYKQLYRLKKDDIVINKIWTRHGSVAVVSDEFDGLYGSSEFPTFVPNCDKLYPRWFHWITQARWFWQFCAEKSHGTSGKNRIRPERFLEIEIPLPPLAEQRRIVARIETLAAKVEAARDFREQAMGEAEGLIYAQARKILAGVTAKVTKLQDWLNLDRAGIQTGPFGAQLSSKEFTSSGVPVLTIGNVQFDGLKLDGLKYVSEEKAKQLERFALEKGDILFARMGTVGRCCVVPQEAKGWLINYHIIRVALDTSQIEPRFIHWTIQASVNVEAYLGENIRGATRRGVNSKIVGGLPCRIPPLPEQRRIVAHLDALQTRLTAVQQHQAAIQARLDALLPSILDRAFRGEL